MVIGFMLLSLVIYLISTIILFAKHEEGTRHDWETITINIVSGGMLACLVLSQSL